jgi:trans-aconitate methyltransferase
MTRRSSSGGGHSLTRGYVVDIGCGNGTFLKALCRVWPECRALGRRSGPAA